MRSKVIIYQDQLPHYRKTFFECTRQLLKNENLDFELVIQSRLNFKSAFKLFQQTFSENDILILPFSIRRLEIYALLLVIVLAFFLGKKRICKYIWWGIGHMPGEGILIKLIRIQFMRLVDTVILYTERERYLYSILSKGAVQYFAFNNSINSGHADKHAKTSTAPTKTKIGFIGTLHARSGAEKLPGIILSCLKEDPLLSFEIVGEGPLYHEVKERLAHVSQVHFWGAQNDQIMVRKILSSWKLGIYPGAAGLTSYTYLDNCTPYVCHDDAFHQSPEHSQLPVDIKISTHGNTVSELTATILRTYHDDALLRRISTDMSNYRLYYTPERAAQRFIDAIKKLVEK